MDVHVRLYTYLCSYPNLCDTCQCNVGSLCFTSAGSDQPVDVDGDGVSDLCDNCPDLYNPDQWEHPNEAGVGLRCSAVACPDGVLWQVELSPTKGALLHLASVDTGTVISPSGLVAALTHVGDAISAHYELHAFSWSSSAATSLYSYATPPANVNDANPFTMKHAAWRADFLVIAGAWSGTPLGTAQVPCLDQLVLENSPPGHQAYLCVVGDAGSELLLSSSEPDSEVVRVVVGIHTVAIGHVGAASTLWLPPGGATELPLFEQGRSVWVAVYSGVMVSRSMIIGNAFCTLLESTVLGNSIYLAIRVSPPSTLQAYIAGEGSVLEYTPACLESACPSVVMLLSLDINTLAVNWLTELSVKNLDTLEITSLNTPHVKGEHYNYDELILQGLYKQAAPGLRGVVVNGRRRILTNSEFSAGPTGFVAKFYRSNGRVQIRGDQLDSLPIGDGSLVVRGTNVESAFNSRFYMFIFTGLPGALLPITLPNGTVVNLQVSSRGQDLYVLEPIRRFDG
jgi:hypothetical protein